MLGLTDVIFNEVLRQVILGPDDWNDASNPNRPREYNSALWGGTSSLVPTMVGNDMQPFNGSGVNLIWDTDRQ